MTRLPRNGASWSCRSYIYQSCLPALTPSFLLPLQPAQGNLILCLSQPEVNGATKSILRRSEEATFLDALRTCWPRSGMPSDTTQSNSHGCCALPMLNNHGSRRQRTCMMLRLLILSTTTFRWRRQHPLHTPQTSLTCAPPPPCTPLHPLRTLRRMLSGFRSVWARGTVLKERRAS